MTINETTSMNTPIVVKDSNNNDITVGSFYCNIDKSNMSMSVGMSVSNKDAVINNPDLVKQQYQDFYTYVSQRATQMGIVIF